VANVHHKIDITVGALVAHNDVVLRIQQIIDFDAIVATEVESGRSRHLRIGELQAIEHSAHTVHSTLPNLNDIADKDWQIAQSRFSAIKPIVDGEVIGRKQTEQHAQTLNLGRATIYRWLKLYNARGLVSDLIPQKRGWKQGRARLSPSADSLVDDAIQEVYLTPQRSTAQKVILEVRRQCHAKNMLPPSDCAIRHRIAQIPEKTRLQKRGYKDLAANQFYPVPGKFPNAEYPLAVVQIDHTPADIILVDDVNRQPIGRPWITLACDIYSRTVVGYYLSFDEPSSTSVGLCIAHSALPKEGWLARHEVDAEWPIWGLPKTIHVDNGTDFRSATIEKSCIQHGINLEFRPVKVPRYGGHIERLLGTLLKEIHDLPGTTFSSIKDKEGYNPEKHAAITFSEFETWLVTLITKVYHRRKHATLGMTPLKQWEIGVFGNASTEGMGLPQRPLDPANLTRDFLPAFQRTIQTTGVTIDDRRYYAEALRPWIGARDKKSGSKRQFTFRRDPRDISTIWFFDPDLQQYFDVPFADLSLPSISLWEYKQIRHKLKVEGNASVNEAQLLQAIEEGRTQVEQSVKRTKSARRKAQKRKQHEKKTTPDNPTPRNAALRVEDDALDALSDDIVPNIGDVF